MGEFKTTGEVAAMCSVPVYTIRKWKKRGDLPSAPQGRSGQGRGNELLWSPAAVEEALSRAAEDRNTGYRPLSTPATQDKP